MNLNEALAKTERLLRESKAKNREALNIVDTLLAKQEVSLADLKRLQAALA